MKLSDLTPNESNPRTITPEKLKQFAKALAQFGSLDGIVFNKKSKKLVGGHQRQKIGGDAQITITKKFSKPTKTGTLSEGYVDINGEKFPYREVWWTEAKEKAANIAANKGAGDWDFPQLSTWLKELSNFDSNFDVELTMFDLEELKALPDPIEVSAHTRVKGSGKDEDEKEVEPARCKKGQVYLLGDAILKIGSAEHHYFDQLISRWEKLTGQSAVLQSKTQIKKLAPQAQSHARG